MKSEIDLEARYALEVPSAVCEPDWSDLSAPSPSIVKAAKGAQETDDANLIVPGVNSFPSDVPPEMILLGNGMGRRGDIITAISTAGGGKSVGMAQAGMAWGLGLEYFGIRPARPLRVIHFCGEDDAVTIGQCREGFLDHAEEITGRKVTREHLKRLDDMLRTDFCREHVGIRFHARLTRLLTESPADIVIINPLLSYVGGEIVACASEWLRAGLMPILQQFGCAAMIAHHTPKMAKDGWDNTDDTYSAIGGGEMANIPRSILTLRPTPADGLSVLKVSKRQTTGWRDSDGNFSTSFFVKRSANPERPAWIPVSHEDAEAMISESKGSSKGSRTKASIDDVAAALETGDMQRQALIEWIMRECKCSDRPAREAITAAVNEGLATTYTETNPRGGRSLRWYQLNREEIQ